MAGKRQIPIRVLVVTNVYPTSSSPGTPSVQDQVEDLKKMGVVIDLLLIRKGSLISFLQAAWNLFLLNFQKQKYDLVHTYFGHSAFLARCQFRCPIVATYLGSDLLGRGKINGRDGFIGRTSLLWATRVITMTKEMKAASKRKDARVIPFGVNTDIFTPQPIHQARADLDLSQNKKLILFPWDPQRTEKRFSLVEETLNILRTANPEVEVIPIHGKPRQIIASYMNACDVLILTSIYEGSPVAVREAMACNLPIVSVDVGDVAGIISETSACFIVDRDPEDIANKIQQIFDMQQRSNGVEKAQKLNSQWSSKQVLEIYQELLQ